MTTTTFEHDIRVLYVTASSFPDGIMDAHEKLHSLVLHADNRKFFGVSRPEENKGIIYRSAAEEITAGEAEQLGLDTLVLKKGTYVSLMIEDYATDVQCIGKAFRELLEQPGLDPQGYCVEWYVNDKDVLCMVRKEG